MASPTLVTVEGILTPVTKVQEIEFYITVPVRSALEPDVWLPHSILATVNQTTGAFSVDIPGSNDPAWSPSNWTYRITERGENYLYSYYAQVPYDAGTLNYSEILPALTPDAGEAYAPFSHGSHTLVLGIGDPVPVDTPPNTVIVRI